jgi:hypothetical protein
VRLLNTQPLLSSSAQSPERTSEKKQSVSRIIETKLKEFWQAFGFCAWNRLHLLSFAATEA